MQTPLDQAAKQYPSKKFAIVDGCAVPDPKWYRDRETPPRSPFKEQEAGCSIGAVAGQMEATVSKLRNCLAKHHCSGWWPVYSSGQSP